ncbi:MAG: hypothetical protein P8H06_07950 [Luminiphilus sp.]|nr:hypothetical protein [Luminiphilus sp.]
MDEPFPSAVKTAKTAPEVEGFFDVATSTLAYVVTSPGTCRCTIIDPVLDYDENSAAVNTECRHCGALRAEKRSDC